ncbi:MAG: DUF4367 domain-containing protein [Oscillospiraceae bacterium]|jgi:hypothetical protein|nr:DUF4367 domain-containing protein [Oscillospiraceae bacterium]
MNNNCDRAHALLDLTNIPSEPTKRRAYKRLVSQIQAGSLDGDTREKMEDTVVKTRKTRKILLIAAALACVVGMTTAAYASGIAQKIIARFQVGGMEITRVEEELPVYEAPASGGEEDRTADGGARNLSLSEARDGLGGNFAAPRQLPEGYAQTGCVLHGAEGAHKAVELQYGNAGGDLISLLISAGENGIQTTEEVRVRTVGEVEIYYANGIVLWEYDGFTYELYHMGTVDLDDAAIDGMVGSLTTE